MNPINPFSPRWPFSGRRLWQKYFFGQKFFTKMKVSHLPATLPFIGLGGGGGSLMKNLGFTKKTTKKLFWKLRFIFNLKIHKNTAAGIFRVHCNNKICQMLMTIMQMRLLRKCWNFLLWIFHVFAQPSVLARILQNWKKAKNLFSEEKSKLFSFKNLKMPPHLHLKISLYCARTRV